jgi:hypothetical protein
LQGPYKVIKNLGQGTLEIKRLYKKENSMVVNMAIVKPFKQPTREQIEQQEPCQHSMPKSGRERRIFRNCNLRELQEAKKQIENLIITPSSEEKKNNIPFKKEVLGNKVSEAEK